MTEHDWHNFPGDCPYVICWNCYAIFDSEDNCYFRKGAYDKPPSKEDPGCTQGSQP